MQHLQRQFDYTQLEAIEVSPHADATTLRQAACSNQAMIVLPGRRVPWLLVLRA